MKKLFKLLACLLSFVLMFGVVACGGGNPGNGGNTGGGNGGGFDWGDDDSGDSGSGDQGGSGDSGSGDQGGSGDSGSGDQGGSGDSGSGDQGGSGDSGSGDQGSSGSGSDSSGPSGPSTGDGGDGGSVVVPGGGDSSGPSTGDGSGDGGTTPDTPTTPDQGGDTGTGARQYTVNFSANKNSLTGSIKVSVPVDSYENALLDALIAGFNTEYPNVTVTKTTFAMDSYEQNIQTGYTAGNLADIIWTDSAKAYYLISQNVALDLDDLMTDAATFDDTEFGSSAFNAEFKKMGTYKGSRYAIPRSIDSVMTFYNKTLMTAMGVDMTQYRDGWTWDEFLEVCQKYVDLGMGAGYYPIDPNLAWESVSYPILQGLGIEYINSNGEFAMSDAQIGQVYDFIKNLADLNYIPDLGAKENALSSFQNGSGAMLFQSTTVGKLQAEPQVKDKFDIVPFPLIGETPTIGTGFAGYAVNNKVTTDQTKLDCVGAFISFLMSWNGQEALADAGLTTPSIREDLTSASGKANATWYTAYSATHNMDAYTWGSQYKSGLDFVEDVDLTKVSGLVGALNKFAGNYCRNEDKATAISYFKTDIAGVYA